jgi:murein DD-endopeptidase MepM/ murein hydrolase activator NlpD
VEAPNGKTVSPIEQGKYTVTSKPSKARSINGGPPKEHKGVDLGSPEGTPVRAVKDGTVVGIRTETVKDARGQPLRNPDGSVKMKGYGNYVVVQHADGTTTRYAHLSSFNKNPDFKVGQKIGAGTVVGEVGHTGRSVGKTGNHLHFELRNAKNVATDPMHFIK